MPPDEPDEKVSLTREELSKESELFQRRDVAQLAAGTFAESVEVARDLVIAGTGSAASVIGGRLLVSGATSDVTLAGLRVDTTGADVAGCWPRALAALGGAEVAPGAMWTCAIGDGRPALQALRRRLRKLWDPWRLVSARAVGGGWRRSISGTDFSSEDARGAAERGRSCSPGARPLLRVANDLVYDSSDFG